MVNNKNNMENIKNTIEDNSEVELESPEVFDKSDQIEAEAKIGEMNDQAEIETEEKLVKLGRIWILEIT